MTVDDSLDMPSVGGATMSPDGNSVLYSKSELNWKENKRDTKWYLVPAGGSPGDAFQFIGDAGGSSVQFSPDGKHLSLKRNVDGKSQIFWMRTGGGEAVQLTKHSTSVGNYKWTADGQKIFFVAPVEKSEADKKKHDQDDAIFIDEAPNGQRLGQWNQLWVFDVKTKKARALTGENLIVSSFDPSPDGTRVAYTARSEARRNQQNRAEIYVLGVTDGLRTRLTENNAPESNVLWAPDSGSILYSANDDKEWELRNSKLWILDPDSREQRMLSAEFEGNVRGAVWTPDSTQILFVGQQRTDSNFYRLNLSSGQIEQLTELTGSVGGASFSKDRTKVVYSFSDSQTPGELFVASVSNFLPRQVTAVHAGFAERYHLASMRVIRWQSKDGLEIEGLLHLPASYREGARIPLILNIHGGPAGAFGNSFRASYHIYAGLGYGSLSPNVRGSSAYTDQLLRGNMRDIGNGDYEDLMSGVDEVIEMGIADREHLGVRGWSYGGILGGFTITKTDRFKAASIGAGVYDWASEYGPGFNHDIRLWYIGGTPWENPEGYRDASTLTHVAKITTPTILFHGLNDTTDTVGQSMMLFTALKDLGRTVRFIKFPREGHGIREPRHRRTLDIAEIEWFQKHVMGEDWKPWQRKEAVAKPNG
jgi:dipeptidyl aminopeptidase/acylaminoacyl peptidase